MAVEEIAKATENNWRSRFKGLSEWAKTDYLGDLTKQQAIQYKEHLISIGHETSTVINTIGAFSGFWNWAIDHEIVQINIWSGLKKRLGTTKKEPLPSEEIFEAATKKAATITERRKTIDYQFLIQRYTGCRQSEAAGLRHNDIDLKNRTIHFEEWEQEVHFIRIRGGERLEQMVRRLKGRSKDERTVPINTALYEILKKMPLSRNNQPLWPLRYKSTNDSWGAHHTSEYTNKYGFSSHKLRSYAVTKLTIAGISPFIIYEITRHKIAGLSDVIQQYTRPSTDELRQAMEILI